MKDYKNPEYLIGETVLLKQLTKQLLGRAMQAEMTDHLGYEKNAPAKKKTSNSRNGSYKKRVKGEFGNLDIYVPVTVIPALSRSSFPRARVASPVSMTR
jgi:putative transposase